jgi:hypothetical protein
LPPASPISLDRGRNVVVRGTDLNPLVGREFTLGAVRCRAAWHRLALEPREGARSTVVREPTVVGLDLFLQVQPCNGGVPFECLVGLIRGLGREPKPETAAGMLVSGELDHDTWAVEPHVHNVDGELRDLIRNRLACGVP